ncbi:molybdopterin converting factor subunit 1 [Sphingopyxis sp. MWB1]|uniref:molybdopterin converting factor subunit 1 n=1 Tax=Sphingopyxis sp. MWB1 TaxID=1537715 RepID=UPI000AF53E0E|nr:molybdopterin converting factor subunit 1 [Sphingopyxis sp. MWB1]
MLRLCYFAWVREAMGVAEEELRLPDDVATVGALIGWLAGRDARGGQAFAEPARIRAAVDGEMVGADHRLAGAGEVALFPPVTGG